MKICKKCGGKKKKYIWPIGKVEYRCLPCYLKKQKERRKISDYDAKWRESNREKLKKQSKEFRERHIESERKRSRDKYLKYRKERPEIFKKWYEQYKNNPKAKWKGYKNNAKTRGLKFSISFDDFIEFWKIPCSYCGSKIETIGIDRIDNEIGYEKGNLKSCCGWCNKMKMDHSEKDFIAHCKAIVKHY